MLIWECYFFKRCPNIIKYDFKLPRKRFHVFVSTQYSNQILNSWQNFRTAGILSNVSMNLATFFFGIILDKYGSFWCRFWSILIITIGLVILMFVPEIEWFLFLGIILYSAPTFTLLMTNHQLAALFPKGSNKISKNKFFE